MRYSEEQKQLINKKGKKGENYKSLTILVTAPLTSVVSTNDAE